jgi:hypothetical protein
VEVVEACVSDQCDDLSLGLPEIACVLIYTGTQTRMPAFDTAADEFIVYGPAERAAVLAEVGMVLVSRVAEQDLGPGDVLLPSLTYPA